MTMKLHLDEALRWYWQNRFSADDVTRATGLTERAQRELLKAGVIQAIPQARTKARLLDSKMVKRIAVIAPLNSCGLSLVVSGQIVFAAPMFEDMLFKFLYDPIVALLEGERDPVTFMPLERRKDCRDFDPAVPAAADPEHDWTIDILNNRYVAVGSGPVSVVFGEISSDKTHFSLWKKAVDGLIQNYGTPEEKFTPRYEYDKSMSSDILNFHIKDTTEEEEEKAKLASVNSVTKISVNVSLSLKIAMRRLLYIDPPEGA